MVKVFQSKPKGNGHIEFAHVYFIFTIKTVINFNYDLENIFQEILYRIGNWINKGSRWVTESIETEFANISVYSPLSGSTYLELSNKSRNPIEDLINIKSNDSKCFLWCHIRH